MKHKKNPVVQIVLMLFGLAILGSAMWGFWYLKTHKPKARRRKKPPTLKPMVEVAPLKPSNVTVKIRAMGTVIPVKEATLRAQISGRITWQNDAFAEGGVLSESMEVIKIDDDDYTLATKQARAGVTAAETNLTLEKGNQDVAKREWEMLAKEVGGNDADDELALRRPQLRAKEAELTLAKLKLEQSLLNEARTTIKTPFNAVVKTVDAHLGDLATAQTVLGTLVGTDAYWVKVSVPMSQLRWVRMPGTDTPGAEVQVHQSDGVIRTGRVVKLLSDVETSGRMAQVLVEIKDPLDLSMAPADRRRPLLLNEFVEVTIIGEELKAVFAIDRAAFRDGSQLWLLTKDKTLTIRDVEPAWSEKDRVYLDKGVGPDLRLITSNLGYPLEGMKLRVKGEPDPEPAGEDGGKDAKE